MEKNPITSQPRPEAMDVYHDFPLTDEEANAPCHRHCHIARLRQLLIPVVLAFLTLVGILLLCPFDITDGHSIFSRAVGDAGSSTGNGSFVDNKLYLIVVFVGLLVVVILGICLSFWCCKGAFENPCCCPCYLCACCGGLACLECIGCGLCAAGAEAM
ncbi:uncharacterized protein EV420DRAFT_854720 [Desarmillaria tabescens]|uniref:Transmembrane protein n=1 Tax=Armillaria tabescens TaxID=1929756 RepID=A0AA39JSX5_ARMTA|nr:uncharacterized protein EV420DRAFT_854720 [Desarmillaria tabescens]KAK0448342.1 hypothetical protein EV420DRAFT_854720 [Desarmillaria tabescens]